MPYRPVDSQLSALSADRDKLPSGKQTLALTLTWVLVSLLLHCPLCLDGSVYIFLSKITRHAGVSYKFKLEDGAEIKPQVPLLNNRIYDNKFESQFYMISDSNKVYHLFFTLIIQ